MYYISFRFDAQGIDIIDFELGISNYFDFADRICITL